MQNVNKGFGLLFEMGCGKTLTAIAIAGAGYQMGKVERLLIVAPTSVVAVWPKELQEYAKFKYTCKTLLGEKKQRIKQIDDLLKFPFKALKVAVINYESTWRPEILEKLKEFDADNILMYIFIPIRQTVQMPQIRYWMAAWILHLWDRIPVTKPASLSLSVRMTWCLPHLSVNAIFS